MKPRYWTYGEYGGWHCWASSKCYKNLGVVKCKVTEDGAVYHAYSNGASGSFERLQDAKFWVETVSRQPKGKVTP